MAVDINFSSGEQRNSSNQPLSYSKWYMTSPHILNILSSTLWSSLVLPLLIMTLGKQVDFLCRYLFFHFENEKMDL